MSDPSRLGITGSVDFVNTSGFNLQIGKNPLCSEAGGWMDDVAAKGGEDGNTSLWSLTCSEDAHLNLGVSDIQEMRVMVAPQCHSCNSCSTGIIGFVGGSAFTLHITQTGQLKEIGGHPHFYQYGTKCSADGGGGESHGRTRCAVRVAVLELKLCNPEYKSKNSTRSFMADWGCMSNILYARDEVRVPTPSPWLWPGLAYPTLACILDFPGTAMIVVRALIEAQEYSGYMQKQSAHPSRQQDNQSKHIYPPLPLGPFALTANPILSAPSHEDPHATTAVI
ncbi:hypothetical protein EDD85DRAFT_796854 [Armillaria nabsnona]|nr:hypothetical protein EDD85DRAFT_796854 [Armillaria nabsnona]